MYFFHIIIIYLYYSWVSDLTIIILPSSQTTSMNLFSSSIPNSLTIVIGRVSFALTPPFPPLLKFTFNLFFYSFLISYKNICRTIFTIANAIDIFNNLFVSFIVHCGIMKENLYT